MDKRLAYTAMWSKGDGNYHFDLHMDGHFPDSMDITTESMCRNIMAKYLGQHIVINTPGSQSQLVEYYHFDLPPVANYYLETTVAKHYSAISNAVKGVTWFGPFWPQGVVILGVREDMDDDKPITKWQVCLRAYDSKLMETVDGYSGHWVVAQEFDDIPTKSDILLVLGRAGDLE